jgi:polyprenyl-phospho-N-acetylgalactosaminyl synthase
MNLLQFFFIISGIIILILAIDISKKQKFNALHFLVFLWVGWWLLVFTIFPDILNRIWYIFWVARWADVLVYTSIIFLLYFVLLLLAKHVENRDSITSLVREISIENSSKKVIDWTQVFLIRAYNEWLVIKWVIDDIINAWYKNILVIDDGSTDWSNKIFKSFWNKLVVVRHLKNRGAWAALETWFEYLRRFWEVKYIISFDADGQHSIKDLDNFTKEFKNDKDLWVVLGSRFIKKTNSNVPFLRKITLFLWRVFTFFVSGVYLTDAHNGYRVFTLKSIKKIKLTIDWMAYASEVIEEIKSNKIKFKEVPVNINYTKYSLSKWQKDGNAINIAFRFIWNKFFK